MDTNLYALEHLVADRLAHARADAARRGLVSALRPRAQRAGGNSRPTAAARRWLGLTLIGLGRALVGDHAVVTTHAGPRGG